MANYCSYSLKVKGKKESVDEFVQIITADYNTTNGLENPKHFYRVFEADVSEYEEDEDDIVSTVIDGECAWSVSSCMRDGRSAYYEANNQDNGVCLEIVTKELGLTVEYFSEECGNAFNEHALIDNGKVLIDDVIDWYEIFIEEDEEDFAPFFIHHAGELVDFVRGEMKEFNGVNQTISLWYSEDEDSLYVDDDGLKTQIVDATDTDDDIINAIADVLIANKDNTVAVSTCREKLEYIKNKYTEARDNDDDYVAIGGYAWEFQI
jgi:hypothetical protein